MKLFMAFSLEIILELSSISVQYEIIADLSPYVSFWSFFS